MDTKNFITERSFDIFLHKGYENTSLSELVKDSQLSKGAFYYHFKNKEKLYEEVIDRYFLNYYREIDWKEWRICSLLELEKMIQSFYLLFVPEILSSTTKGMSQYFIMFFEAYHMLPQFKKTVRDFYTSLKNTLEFILKREGEDSPELKSKEIICKYEGLMFWLSLFPEENINELIGHL